MMNYFRNDSNRIYLIGGAARSGKTRLTRRLFDEQHFPYFCVDYFVSGLQEGAPQLGIIGESPNATRAPRLWPVLVGTLRNIVEVEPHYTVDGDALWPEGVAALQEEYPGQVRAVFLGYTQIDPQAKLAEVRHHAGGWNDWLQAHTDGYILDLVNEMIGFSRLIAEECARWRLPYFDVSEDFPAVLEQAYQALMHEG